MIFLHTERTFVYKQLGNDINLDVFPCQPLFGILGQVAAAKADDQFTWMATLARIFPKILFSYIN